MCVFQIVRLVLQVVIATHFVGCFFYWVSQLDESVGHWYTDPTIPATLFDQYVAGVYWALTTVRLGPHTLSQLAHMHTQGGHRLLTVAQNADGATGQRQLSAQCSPIPPSLGLLCII